MRAPRPYFSDAGLVHPLDPHVSVPPACRGVGPSHHFRTRRHDAPAHDSRPAHPASAQKVTHGRWGEAPLLDDVFLETLNELDDLALFGLGHLELRQGRCRMTEKDVPVALADAHASVSEGHVPAAVVRWSASAGAEVVDEELLL